MNIGWLSPLPPAGHVSAHSSRRLLPVLARQHTVTVWTPTNDPSPIERVKVLPLRWSEDLFLELSGPELLVYHLAAEPEAHGIIWDLSRLRCGVVVLHDGCLGKLLGTVLGRFQNDYTELRRLLTWEMGTYGSYLADDIECGLMKPENLGQYADLIAAATENALAAVVNDGLLANRLRGFHPMVKHLDIGDADAWCEGLLKIGRDPDDLRINAGLRQAARRLRGESTGWPTELRRGFLRHAHRMVAGFR